MHPQDICMSPMYQTVEAAQACFCADRRSQKGREKTQNIEGRRYATEKPLRRGEDGRVGQRESALTADLCSTQGWPASRHHII